MNNDDRWVVPTDVGVTKFDPSAMHKRRLVFLHRGFQNHIQLIRFQFTCRRFERPLDCLIQRAYAGSM